MFLRGEITLKLNTTDAMSRVSDAVFSATRDVVEEIRSTAAEGSPVLAKATAERYPAENRDSISSSVEQVKEGVRARVFTTSGYGAYLELGTSKMSARPYLWPAVEQHIGELPEAVRAELGD